MENENLLENSRILITGASGFIGMHLSAFLSRQGLDPVLMVRKAPVGNQSETGQRNKFVIANLTDEKSLLQACSGIDVVFHLAGVAHAGTSDARLLQSVNVQGTKNLIAACQANGVRRLVFLSSILAHQVDQPGQSAGNSDAYATSKKQAEDLLLAAASDSFEPVILRPVNVYGPGMKGNIASLIRRIKGGSIPPLPRLNNPVHLVGVEDVCRAALLAAVREAAVGKTYVIADFKQYTPNSIERAIYEALGQSRPGWNTPRSVFYLAALGAQCLSTLGLLKNDLGMRTYRNLVGDNAPAITVDQARLREKVETELGFKPSQDLQQVLPEIIASD